jgi:hypothetical protein
MRGRSGSRCRKGEAVTVTSPVADPNVRGATTLREFLATAGDLTGDERRDVVDQALLLIEQLYVHLPLKRAMHAVDPLQRLKLLRQRLAGLSERRFHDEMISIFTGLRDLHTNYVLPDPFQTKTAFLPFRIEAFSEAGVQRHLVAATVPSLDDERFKPGVEVTHWNGIPINRAVELNAERQAGSNLDARHARGLNTMTLRPMALSAPPDEDWVTIGFRDEDGPAEIRLDWRIFEPEPAPSGVYPDDASVPLARGLGIDALAEGVRRASKTLFVPEAIELERRTAVAPGSADGVAPTELGEVSAMPDVLQFRAVQGPQGEAGYLRIRTFMVGDVDAFLAEVIRILALLPQGGLIIDVRGNGGGIIMAGERLLQLFTPRPIEPERLHFINTTLVLRLCSEIPELEPWRDSIEESVATGSPFSDGFPILQGHTEDCNDLGQHYYGPVALVTDALCYSTTDIFAAGFQDHAIGPVIGTSGNTGAGGANVWTQELLRQLLGAPLTALPRRTSFRVAIRRTTRVGARAGDPVEDIGVVPDVIHRLTRRDLLEGNPDLIARAAAVLSELPARALTVELREPAKASVTVRGISRLDVHTDGRPRATIDVEDGDRTLDLPAEWGAWRLLELRGFAGDELVAMRRLRR